MSDVDKAGEPAVYKQIEMRLRGMISRGEWRPGAMLPSRRELAKLYGVSPLTIERAVTGMIADHVLRADDRRGTFVTETPPAASAAQRDAASADSNHLPLSGMTIGIVGSLYESRHDHIALNNEWVRLLVHSIESAASRDSNRSCFFNRVKNPATPLQPLYETVSDARNAGVNAVAVIGIGVRAAELDKALTASASSHNRFPIVVVSSDGSLQRPVPHVFYDNYGAGYEAASHLIAAGCQRLMIFAPTTAPWATERINGIRAAATHSGAYDVVVAPECPVPWDQDQEPTELAYCRANELLRTTDVPDGVICIQDQGAFGFMNAAEERGLAAGRDYAVIGFDDNPRSRVVRLSTMRPPIEAMGNEAARLLRRALLGESANYQVNLRWDLIARASTEFTGHEPSANAQKDALATLREI